MQHVCVYAHKSKHIYFIYIHIYIAGLLFVAVTTGTIKQKLTRQKKMQLCPELGIEMLFLLRLDKSQAGRAEVLSQVPPTCPFCSEIKVSDKNIWTASFSEGPADLKAVLTLYFVIFFLFQLIGEFTAMRTLQIMATHLTQPALTFGILKAHGFAFASAPLEAGESKL